MSMISNIAFYGLGAAVIVLTWFATTELEGRLSSMEDAIEQIVAYLKLFQQVSL